jgi:Predicted Fe-S oxidoreductases
MEYFAFQWHITDDCDQRCEHCYIFAEDHNAMIKQMSLDGMRSVLKNCLKACEEFGRLPYFYITGGDPILHANFWDLLGMLKEREIPFAILGNPFHLDEAVCRRLASYGCEKYQLSLDGLRETHDSIRKPGSFDATIAKIPIIRDAGMSCAIMTTVSARNLAEIPGLVKVVVENRADIFAFSRYCPTSMEKGNSIRPQDYRGLLERLWGLFDEYKDSETTFNLKDHLWNLFLYEKGLLTIPEGLSETTIYDGCNCGNCHLTILPTGDVYACRRMESPVGNAFGESIHEIFTGEAMDAFRQYDKFEKCSKCELLRFCRGCPAVARGMTGSMYSPDPQCWKDIG